MKTAFKLGEMANTKYIPQLLQLFRQHGYDGATLSKISEATGLGKASLYHHFPGGKDEMVEAVLAALARSLEDSILQPLRSDAAAITRFTQMCDRIRELFEDGKQPCLFAILLMGSSRTVFHAQVEKLLRTWISAIADVLISTGLNPTLATERAEDAVLTIEGALILSQGLNNSTPFQRVLNQLPQQLCDDLDTVKSV